MRRNGAASANGDSSPSSEGVEALSELQGLQTRCRRQTAVLDTLREAVATFRRGANALEAENGELRAENHRLRGSRPRADAVGRLADGETLEIVIAVDARAPGSARAAVARCLEERVVAAVLENAQLLVSELATNSLRHSTGATDRIVVSVELMPAWVRIGVLDSGSDGVIAAQPPDPWTGSGYGLNLVQTLSERWGVERLAGGGTQVWAQIGRSGRPQGAVERLATRST